MRKSENFEELYKNCLKSILYFFEIFIVENDEESYVKWISFFTFWTHTFETSFLIFPPPRRHVVEHEFFVVSSRVETFSRGKRIHNERKLEKELFCSRFEPVESISSRRIVVRKIVQNSLSDHIRIKLKKNKINQVYNYIYNYSFIARI